MATIAVLTSLAIREAYLELVPGFERNTGHTVATVWAGTVDIQRRMAAGDTCDLLMMSSTGLEEQARLGKVDGSTLRPMVKCGIGVAVRAGAPKPDLSSREALRAALLAARSVGYSTGPSGVYLKGLFETLGIADTVAAKTVVVPSGGTVGSLLAAGEAEIGFQQIPELIHVEGVDYAGPLPDAVQHVTTFSGAIHAAAKEPDAARSLMTWLTAPEAAATIRRHGLEPG